MDGHALLFDDASFDAVVSMFGWFLFADRPRALREMHRVLRAGGRLLVTSWATPDRNTMLGTGLEAIRHALPDLPRPPGPLPTQQPEAVAAELRDAGFRDVGTKIVTLSVPISSVDDFWRTFERAGAPFVVLRKKLGEAAWQGATERARAFLRERFGDEPFTLQVEAIYTFGTR
jgi:SAM-dependent methyltransferase